MPFKPDSAADGSATRATKLTEVSSFKLYAYNSGGTAIADGVTYTKSGSSWTTSSKVFWPQTGNVTFYAFSPASNNSVTFNTTSKTLTYTAPTAQGSQQDVLYAYKTSSRPSNNTVDLTFNHANAAFSVSARLADGCTATVNVSGVQLVNVKPTNTLTFTNGNATASGNNISSTLACSAKTLTTSNQAISSSPLIIPPQSVTAWSGTSALANTYLAVTCKVSENDSYVVGSASANGTVYVPMDKTLNKGEDNSVNLVFGTLTDGKRSYGRDDNGNRITISEKTYVNGHEAVDLGLSVKWAAENFWDETWSNDYGYWGYCNRNNLTNAAKSWGDTWSVPTKDQFQELLDNCTITKDSIDMSTSTFYSSIGSYISDEIDGNMADYFKKIPGYRFTSKINGNSIFLMSGGILNYNGNGLNPSNITFREFGTHGYYWTSDLAGVKTKNVNETDMAYYFLEWGPYNVTPVQTAEKEPYMNYEFDAHYLVRFVCP